MKTTTKTIRFLMSLLLFIASHDDVVVQAQRFGNNLFRKQTRKLSLQELQSPLGPRAGVFYAPISGKTADGTAVSFTTFANELVVPDTGGFNGGTPAGTQTGYCIQVWDQKQLACYINFALPGGRILAEGLFDLVDFPSADLVITGGSGQYLGIVGTAKTRFTPDFDGTTLFFDFDYMIMG
jgi:hypothetical protein